MSESVTTEMREVSIKLPVLDISPFMEMVAQFRRGETDAQRAEKVRAQDQSDGLESLKRLYELAHGCSGQCKYVAKFLLGLYNGTRFPFDLTDLRCLDEAIFEDCLKVLRMDSRPFKEVHLYFERGGETFEKLAIDWRIKDRSGDAQ